MVQSKISVIFILAAAYVAALPLPDGLGPRRDGHPRFSILSPKSSTSLSTDLIPSSHPHDQPTNMSPSPGSPMSGVTQASQSGSDQHTTMSPSPGSPMSGVTKASQSGSESPGSGSPMSTGFSDSESLHESSSSHPHDQPEASSSHLPHTDPTSSTKGKNKGGRALKIKVLKVENSVFTATKIGAGDYVCSYCGYQQDSGHLYLMRNHLRLPASEHKGKAVVGRRIKVQPTEKKRIRAEQQRKSARKIRDEKKKNLKKTEVEKRKGKKKKE